jgi:hypothetical protein
MLNNKNPKIFISPINQSIVDAIKQFDPTGEKIGIILSQRQHTTEGGYVSLRIINQLYEMPNLIERDHFHNTDFDDNDISHFEYDGSCFDIIHLDPWSNKNGHLPGYAKRKLRKWEKQFRDIKPNIQFEIGTEEFICILESNKLKDIIDQVVSNRSIKYIVCQGGSVVFNLTNQAAIDVEKTKSFVELAKTLGCQVKRHNCDFHTDEELALLSSIGVDAFNFAPEFTYIHNKIVADSLLPHEVLFFHQRILESAPWDRWLTSDAKPIEFLYACLHYITDQRIDEEVFNNQKEITQKINDRLKEIWAAIN